MPTNPLIQAAFNRLGNALAGYDLEESAAKTALQNNLGISKKNRTGSLKSKREGLSGQGLLHSSIALDEGAKVNTDYDTYDNNLMTQNAAQLAQLGLKRTAAQNQYNDEKAKIEADEAAAAGVILPTPTGTTSPSVPGAITPPPLINYEAGMINPYTLPGGTPNPNANTPAPVAPYDDPTSPYYEGVPVDTPYVDPYAITNSGVTAAPGPQNVIQANPADPLNWQGIRVAQLMAIINGPDDPADPLGWKKIAAIQELKNMGGVSA